MFSIPGLLLLIVVEYMRPQEYFAALSGIPWLHVASALALLGLVIDLRIGQTRLREAPHLFLTLAFFGWCLITLAVRSPAQLVPRISVLLIPLAIYLLVAHAVQSFRMLQVLCGVLLAIALTLSVIGVHQGLAPYGCHRGVGDPDGLQFVFDGRPCSEEAPNECENEGAEPGAEYRCEKVGLLGTSSIHGRVRYRGTLEDPNELALTLSLVIPIALAFVDRRRSISRILLAASTIGLVGLCTYFTQSRGGQLVFLTVLAVYFVKTVGPWRGGVTGLILALPVLLLGGRTGAESSTMERTECWWVGMHLVFASPGFGVGSGQFLEHHYLTAHNSYILAAAELGLPGLLLWTAIVYVALKIPAQILRSNAPPVAQSWALALLASMTGLVVGMLFLSYVYKDVLWIYIGLSGVLYHAVRRHDPEFKVQFGAGDLIFLSIVDLSLMAVFVGYTGLKLGW